MKAGERGSNVLGRRILATIGAAAVVVPLLAGCAQLPFADDSFEREIPAALEAADLGITEASASISISGFVETLNVGGTLAEQGDPDALSAAGSNVELDDDLVAEIIRVALDARSVSTSRFHLILRDGSDEFIDVEPALTRLGATPSTASGSIAMDDAERIAAAAG